MYTRGMGDPGTQIVGYAGSAAGAIVPGVLASQAAAMGAGTTILGMAPALAVPVIGAAIAGVTILVTMFLNRNAKYHAQETATTHIVDEAEKLMQQNLDAWRQSHKTQSEQAQAVANYNAIWSQVVQACNQPQYEDPGQRCIHDRERGGRWPWPEYYLDPIQDDPGVEADPVSAAVSSVTGLFSGGGSDGAGVNWFPILAAAGAAFLIAEAVD